ncbi:hypothetical protein EON65_55445 [archaeon]|nr:MAG: hypothetical protein EON65_55445 [archaeon]
MYESFNMTNKNKPCDYAHKMKEAKDKQDKVMIHLTNNVNADNDLLVLYLEEYDDEDADEDADEDDEEYDEKGTTTTDTKHFAKREVTDKFDEEGTTTTDTKNIITATRREVTIRFQHGLIKSPHILSKQIYNALLTKVENVSIDRCGFRTCYTCRYDDIKNGNEDETCRFILELNNFHVELDTRKSTCGEFLGFQRHDDEHGINTTSYIRLLRTSPVQDIRKPLTWMTPGNSRKPTTCTCGADIMDNWFIYDYETQEGKFAGEEADDDDENIDGRWNGLQDDY